MLRIYATLSYIKTEYWAFKSGDFKFSSSDCLLNNLKDKLTYFPNYKLKLELFIEVALPHSTTLTSVARESSVTLAYGRRPLIPFIPKNSPNIHNRCLFTKLAFRSQWEWDWWPAVSYVSEPTGTRSRVRLIFKSFFGNYRKSLAKIFQNHFV